MPRIEFVFFDAGGGHRAAATALETAIDQQGLPWEIRRTNLQELLEPLDLLRKASGVEIQDAYNLMLRRGWTFGSARILRVLQLGIRAAHSRIVAELECHWAESQPDMVVSFIPNFNRPLCESYRHVFPERPYVTILTDFADYPPHFWIERQEQYLICGTARAVAQALGLGHPPARVFRVSGMILNPRFYETALVDRAVRRRGLGLQPDLPTGLVLFGGHGSRAMLQIAEQLNGVNLPLQMIYICGRNEELVRLLRCLPSRFPRHVEGFTTKVHELMQLADFFIGKPGPGSLSEALTMQLPAVVIRNAWTLPQERYNADWILENAVGEVVSNVRQLIPAIERLIDPHVLARYRENTSKLQNRAVFEIPEILSRILDRHNSAAATISASALRTGR